MMALENKFDLIETIKKCNETEDIDKRVELIQQLNELLPLEYKFQLPSFITNDYINRRLDLLEEKISLINMSHTL